jgi:predicted ATPase
VGAAETPFDNIEGSHEYIALLAEALSEARREIEQEIVQAGKENAERRKQALLLVSYNLEKLNLHITSSRRILNDLKLLRRVLLAERSFSEAAEFFGWRFVPFPWTGGDPSFQNYCLGFVTYNH